MRFYSSSSDPSLYVREKDGKRNYILIYVDDMVVSCHSKRKFEAIAKALAKQFKFSSLGETRTFLGILIEKQDGHYTLNQAGYIRKIVERFGNENVKSSKIPLDPAYVKQN